MAVLILGFGNIMGRHKDTGPSRPAASPLHSQCDFTVRERQTLLVSPNRPTPSERLYLTNIDDQFGLRFHINLLLFYPSRGHSSMNRQRKNDDPAEIIRDSLGKLLVEYYPFAGRLRDANKSKLIVDCTGEGVLFAEADADISLEDLGDLSPPMPRGFEFIKNVPGSDTITNSPIVLFQVTRLKCGGFVLGLRYNHCMTDGAGVVEFLKALGEIGRGAAIPTAPPVWNRETLQPRAKPVAKNPCFREYYDYEAKYRQTMAPVPATEEMSTKSFFFGSKEIDALKRQVEGVRFCTPFEVISACVWQSRANAMKIPADQEVSFMFPLNARSRFRPRLPTGYYGNTIASAYAKTRARDLTNQPLSFATKLINEGKWRVNEEYIRSMIDLAELNGSPLNASDGSFIISDVSNIGDAMGKVDFGWGKAVYVCPVFPPMPNFSFLTRAMNASEGFAVPVCLPSRALDIFEENISSAVSKGMQT